MLEIEQPWRQRVATEERGKAEGMAKAKEEARAAAEEKALRETLPELVREETLQRFPGRTDPRAYYGLHSASSMLFANPNRGSHR